MLKEAQRQLKLLEEVYELYVSTNDDDKEFEEAKAWMQDCQLEYISVLKRTRMSIGLEKDV